MSNRDRELPAEMVEPASGEVHETGPVVVVTAIELPRDARVALAERLGPGHVVVDIRDAGATADVVLVPPVSGGLIGALRRLFPDAQLLVTEFTDVDLDIDFQGPVSRSIESGVDGYFVVPAMDDLAMITHLAGQAKVSARQAISGGQSSPRLQIPQTHDLAGRLRFKTPTQPVGRTIEIDIEAWAHAVGAEPQTIAEVAWPLVLQVLRQGFDVSAVGVDDERWRDLASASGVDV